MSSSSGRRAKGKAAGSVTLLAGVILFIIATGCTDQPPPTPRNARVTGERSEGAHINAEGPPEQWSPNVDPETITFTGEEFWRITRLENPWEARQLHGKLIEIRGQVTTVALVNGVPQMFVREGGIGPEKEGDIEHFGGRFISADPQPWAIALPGQQITATGRYEMPENDLIRRHGLEPLRIQITSASDDRLVLTAQELAEEFQAQPAATNDKYRERWMEIRGEVLKVDTLPEKSETQVYLRGTDDVSIRCDFAHTGEEKFANALSSGDQVRIAAEYYNFDEDELSLMSCLGIEE